MSDYTVASFSGGKDSTAMVIRMIERGDRLDEVIFIDTGMEFPAMYQHIKRVREYVRDHDVYFTELKAEKSFEWYFFEKPVKNGEYTGYAWPNMHMRWCTKHLKTEVNGEYFKNLRERYGSVVLCTGLAADEQNRIQRPGNSKNRHPLAEWGWTEAMCLGYCYGKGYTWYDPTVRKGLYEIFSRTSCWICPLGTIDNFRQLRRYYPDMWTKIGDMETQMRKKREEESPDTVANTWRYTPRYSWQDLEDRFAMEDMGIKSRTTLEEWA